MNKNLESPTKLTEFAPLQNEEKPQSVGQFISKFFKITKPEKPTTPGSDNVSQESLPNWATEESKKESNVYNVDVNEGRSLPNVLKRISNLLALKSNNLQDYADTELKQYWMPDSVSKECYECCEKFTTFRRRHHCRVCGQIFCSNCCNQQIPGKIFGCTGDLRVCTYCCKVVLSYLQSSDVEADLSADLKLVQENLQTKFGSLISSSVQDNSSLSVNADSSDSNSLKRKISVGYQEEKFALGGPSTSYLTTEERCKALQNSVSLRNLFEEISRPTTGISLDVHRYRLRTFIDCFLGSELVDWLIFQQKAKTRIQASAICQALLQANYITSVTFDNQCFSDSETLYQLGTTLTKSEGQPLQSSDIDEPMWVQQIPQESSTTDSENESPVKPFISSSSYMLDLNLEANTVYLSKPEFDVQSLTTPETEESTFGNVDVKTSEQREIVPEQGWHNAAGLREENGEKACYEALSSTYEQHELCLIKQLLNAKGLNNHWIDILLKLTKEIVNCIRPDKNHDAEELDIRRYVQFKKLSGGLRTDTSLVRGIVCSKNIAHTSMSTDIENPRILLLQCAVVYQRTEGRLMSLEPILMQEHEYLRHAAARIVALNPNVVLVQRNVSRLAQDFLREHKITLVHNVKQSILDRLSRCTQADLVTSVDAHIGRPRLGTCKRFYLKSFPTEQRSKTLMIFEGLPQSFLGSTVLLRGGSIKELTKVKQIASFMLLTAYNWRLEKSFLMDEFAQPPSSKYEFLEDSRENSPVKPRAFVKRVKKEDEMKKITGEVIEDFTDPLHSNKIEQSLEKLQVHDLPLANSFRKALDDTILSISPYLVFSVPFLESEVGRRCSLRKFFPEELYFSEQFLENKKVKRKENEEVKPKEVELELHPFLKEKIVTVDVKFQNLLANFRACGGGYKKRELICTVPQEKTQEEDVIDALDANNHQRLSVLFYSFSHESPSAPGFCVNPWVVNMDFYGRNDIPLGCFLERYCFRSTYMCPFKPCNMTMIKHVRRFVHNAGCVSISLNNFENEFAEEGIVLWSWCTKCQTVSPVVPMSQDTWSFSFAKYLELKFHGDMYSRRGQLPCPHSLHHDHYQYFGYKNFVASFKYNTINVWEISLPPSLIEIHYNCSLDGFIDEVKVLSQKGHEIFSLVLDKLQLQGEEQEKQLLGKEQALFRAKIEEVQLRLTSPSVEQKDFDEKERFQHFWKLGDSLVRIKKMIVETVESWNLRLSERRKDTDKKKDKIEPESPDEEEGKKGFDCEESEIVINVVTSTPTDDSAFDYEVDASESGTNNSPKAHQKSQLESTSQLEDDGKKDNDKKTVKNILSQLLPSTLNLSLIQSPFSVQEHYTLPVGVYCPVVVNEAEPSSIVAYALNSFDYKKAFEEFTKKPFQEPSPSPTAKRRNTSEREKLEGDDKSTGLLGFLRKNESINNVSNLEASTNSEQNVSGDRNEDIRKNKNSHIEIQFQDSNCNFFCRIYLAEKFAALRSMVLPIGEEGYIRSLLRSVQWNARGGKSGSTFSKTIDDRFILKEMSKSEVQLFLDSASKYFVYMQKCYSSGQPTLLGKIVGIYQIIFKNSSNVSLRTNLLVMENLFYKRTVSQKFDLKGSVRNRMVVPDNQEGEIVLLDENLLKMSCESPLYILPHSKTVLAAAIHNDTEFLSSQSVMDYSLLVGLDSENNELVLGIIDYIRTFTWDKKLETMVKKSGILGGQGKLPTVVSPEDYQKRFIKAMHKYFLEVPDHWTGLAKDCEVFE